MNVTGIDLVEIKRMEKSLKNPRFLKRIYSESELSRYADGSIPPQSAAGAFAAKEAFLKALGVGIFDIPLCEISVMHRPSGAPYFSLSGKAESLASTRGLSDIALSITHTDRYAAAVVFASIEKSDNLSD